MVITIISKNKDKSFNNYKNIDIFMKTRRSEQKVEILSLYSIDKEFTDEKNIEISSTRPIQRYADKIYADANGELNIVEFQTGHLKTAQIMRFLCYAVLTMDEHEKPVNVYIVYTEKIPEDYVFQKGDITFKPKIYSLKSFDGDKILKSIKDKIENNIELSQEELIKLEFLPFFNTTLTPQEMLTKTANLTNKLINNISSKKLDHIKTGQAIIALHLFKEKELKNIMDVIKMGGNVFHEIYDEGRTEGKKEGKIEGRIEGKKEGKIEGRIEGKIEVARKLKNEGYNLETIIRLTNLTKKEIKKL